MRVYLVGVSGTGMGALAALLREAGEEVSGSDVAFDPPIGPMLRALGIRCLQGYDAAHLERAPDLVVVGNAIRRSNVEARAVEELGLHGARCRRALREHFLARRRPLVVAGTHGKTTTSAMCAWILSRSGWEPGWFIGGVPRGLTAARRSADADAAGSAGARRSSSRATSTTPSTGTSRPSSSTTSASAGTTSRSSRTWSRTTSTSTPTPRRTRRPSVRSSAPSRQGASSCATRTTPGARHRAEEASARVAWYALERDDTGGVTAGWPARRRRRRRGAQAFDVFAGGMSCGRFTMGVPDITTCATRWRRWPRARGASAPA